MEQQSKQFKLNAEQLEVICEKLAHLSQDKRKARKAYQEEHAKIAARLNHVSDLLKILDIYIYTQCFKGNTCISFLNFSKLIDLLSMTQ